MAANSMAVKKGRGKFISVEGGEGVGKSSFIHGLAEVLRPLLAARGAELILTREPGGTPSADLIRQLFARPAATDPLFVETEALLVSAARAQHVRALLRPALERGAWVLCDRYIDSFRVYQQQTPASDLESLIQYSTANLEPDLTLLLDLDVVTAQQRLAQATTAQRPDCVARYDEAKISTHAALRQGFLDLCARFPQRILRLDASPSAAIVLQNGLEALRGRFHELSEI